MKGFASPPFLPILTLQILNPLFDSVVPDALLSGTALPFQGATSFGPTKLGIVVAWQTIARNVVLFGGWFLVARGMRVSSKVASAAD